MASGMIQALKSRYPTSRITWMLEPQYQELVSHHPLLDAIIHFPKSQFKAAFKEKKWRRLYKLFTSLRQELRDERFDLVIDLQGLLKSAIWAKLSGAPTRLSFSSKEGTNWLMTQVLDKNKNSPEISSEYKQMAQYLGCAKEQFQMQVHLPPIMPDQVLHKLDGLQKNSFFVFCAFTTRPQKHWFEEHWRALAKQIYQQYQMPIYVIGAPSDQENAAILGDNLEFVHSACGKLSLIESIALIQQAKAVVGVDTGMTHAALAKDTPTLALFGSTRPYLNTDRHNARVIYLNKSCSPCRRKPTCDGEFHCLRDISANTVIQALNEIVTEYE